MLVCKGYVCDGGPSVVDEDDDVSVSSVDIEVGLQSQLDAHSRT